MSEENKPRNRYFHCVPLDVEKIDLEAPMNDKKILERVRLFTDLGDITSRQKKVTEEKTELHGFGDVSRKSEPYTKAEFIANNPMLVLLVENCKVKPQRIILSYTEMDEEYKFLNKKQFDSIYYEKFHKKDTSTSLDIQKEVKKKYSTEDMGDAAKK